MTHAYIEGAPVGKRILASQLLKGIYNLVKKFMCKFISDTDSEKCDKQSQSNYQPIIGLL